MKDIHGLSMLLAPLKSLVNMVNGKSTGRSNLLKTFKCKIYDYKTHIHVVHYMMRIMNVTSAVMSFIVITKMNLLI